MMIIQTGIYAVCAAGRIELVQDGEQFNWLHEGVDTETSAPTLREAILAADAFSPERIGYSWTRDWMGAISAAGDRAAISINCANQNAQGFGRIRPTATAEDFYRWTGLVETRRELHDILEGIELQAEAAPGDRWYWR